MSWQSWSLGDWNRALVRAIFFDRDRANVPITRINASNGFLAACTGDPSTSPEEARKSFIRSFGCSEAQLKRHFVVPGKGLTRDGAFPSLIAPLYLTLLAASADEATFDEGDFRKRFAEIVRPLVIPQVDCRYLPAMWALVAQWSKQRHRELGDCRVLVLPPPPPTRYDKLIGISKKLAFPGYKDELGLAELLSHHGLAGYIEPAMEVVQSAVLRKLDSFSEAFKQEFRAFSDLLVHARYKDAVQTPFWGAVLDTTWQCARREASAAGSYELVLDTSDPYDPGLYLLADQRGSERLAHAFQPRALASHGKYGYILEAPGGSQMEPSALARIGRSMGLERQRPWRELLAGCLPFFPDELQTLGSSGTYYEDAPACFLLRAEFSGLMVRRAAQYNLKPTVLDIGKGAWKLVLFKAISRGSMRNIVDAVPDMHSGIAGIGWSRPRPRLSGGAWSGQCLLLNPASNPIVRMAGSVGGIYELFAEDGEVLATGKLEPVEDEGFRIPYANLVGLQDVISVRYLLQTADDEDADGDLRVNILGGVPALALARLKDPREWLADGRSGGLEDFFVQQSHTPQLRPDIALARPSAGHPFLASSNNRDVVRVRREDPADLPESLSWLGEALRLRLESRATLPWDEVKEHISGVSRASGFSSWDISRLLYAGGWLAWGERRTAPYRLTIAYPRTISLTRVGARPVARIVGMLGQAEVARLHGALRDGEAAWRLRCEGTGLSIGAIEVEVDDVGRIEGLAAALGLNVLDREVHGMPLASTVQSRFVVVKEANWLPDDPEVEIWDSREWKWLRQPVLGSAVVDGTMFRYKGRQRYTYWVSGSNGYWKTDSDAWARIFHLASRGEPLGELVGGCDCVLDRRMGNLPLSLVRWWMHWGGGCVSADPGGNLVLCGADGNVDWMALAAWLPRADVARHSNVQVDLALARRHLALRKRLAERQGLSRPARQG